MVPTPAAIEKEGLVLATGFNKQTFKELILVKTKNIYQALNEDGNADTMSTRYGFDSSADSLGQGLVSHVSNG